jgi:hypothetical protein
MPPNQEAVMTEANLFRRYAKEAAHWSSKVISEIERSLIYLACTSSQAPLMSERALQPSLIVSRARRLRRFARYRCEDE